MKMQNCETFSHTRKNLTLVRTVFLPLKETPKNNGGCVLIALIGAERVCARKRERERERKKGIKQ